MAADHAVTVTHLSRLTRLEPANGPAHVLIVEDSRAISTLLGNFISSIHGITAECAGNQAQARALLGQDAQRFFCAVLDLNLPDAPNGEIVDLVQAYGIPVLVLSGTYNDELRQRMLDKQVVDYLVKRNPNEIEHVAYLVGRLFENQYVKVLVVDDSSSYRGYLKELLARYRYRTFEAADGLAALELLNKHPDTALIITDYFMPGIDGRELIERVRQSFRREELAIIALSDHTCRGMSAMLLKAGANDFINKRFEVEEFYCRVTQNTNMIRYVRQVHEAATRDFLTGALNRRQFFAIGEQLYANARRGSLKIAVAIIDADHFKHINDTFGHDVGDRALKAISDALHTAARQSDLLARYGGEEFAILAPVKASEDTSTLFERLRAAVQAIDLQHSGETIHVTVSIGVTTELEPSLDAMLKRADRAVYQAKEAGRNRVVMT